MTGQPDRHRDLTTRLTMLKAYSRLLSTRAAEEGLDGSWLAALSLLGDEVERVEVMVRDLEPLS